MGPRQLELPPNKAVSLSPAAQGRGSRGCMLSEVAVKPGMQHGQLTGLVAVTTEWAGANKLRKEAAGAVLPHQQ